jgi:hypothetical protein
MTPLRILRIAGFGGCWAAFGILLIIWAQAYFAPSQTTLVGVNWYGEAALELLLLPVAFMLGTWAFLSDLKAAWKTPGLKSGVSALQCR